MKAVRLHGRGDIRVDDVAEPSAPGPGEVLLAPLAAGICGTDLHEYVSGPIITSFEPHSLTGASIPQILGHELAGRVLDVGEGVTTVKPGDRVSVMPLIYCGQCYYCRRSLNHLCTQQAGTGLSSPWGGFAEQAIVREYQAAVLPDSLTDEQGVMVEPMAVALYGVDVGGVQVGDTVLIAGAGPIGALCVLAAHAAGAARIYVSEPNAARAASVAALGVTETLDPTAVDLVKEIEERTEGVGVDVSLECVGNEAALNACIEATRRAGTVVQVGLHVARASIDPMLLALKDLTIRATWCYPVTEWPRIIGAIAAGRLPVERVVTSSIALDQIVTQGFDVLLDKASDQIKVLVDPQRSLTGSALEAGSAVSR